jgi:translocation and assembly module TamA
VRKSCYRAWALALALSLATGSFAQAADPQTYNVVVQPTGSEELDDAINTSSLLATLRDKAPVPPFGLIQRAREDISRVETAAQSFGYYLAKVAITIAGRAIDYPNLPMVLDTTPQGQAVEIDIRVETGPLYHFRDISIDGPVPADLKNALKLSPGDPAVATNVQAGQARLLTALQEAGYPLAQVQEPVASADDNAHFLDVSFPANAGPRADIGDINFQGLKTVNEDFARRALTVKSGDPFQPSKLEASRQALLNTGIFAGLSVRPAEQLSPDGRIPIVFDVQERPLHAVKLEGAYSTDLGVRLSAGWSDRNLFGNAEQLNLTGSGTGLWGNATHDIGYLLLAQFIKPAFLRPDQLLELRLAAQKQNLDAYDQTLESIGGTLSRTFSQVWKASAGLNYMHDDVSQKGIGRIYELVSLPLAISYDSTGLTDPLFDPTRGARASFAVTPTQALGARNLTFVILQASAAAYFDVSGNGRSVIAGRALIGSALGASNFDLPPDQRLYAGGSTTVRGYRYQSIGPLFPDGDPIGGTGVAAGSLEFRQRFLESWGAAAFVDAGQVSDQGAPFTGTVRFGAGGGLRYYTGIGAIRADIAFPINPIRGGDSFEIYVGLGQAF